MMDALPPDARRKLVSVLGMLASDAAGERASAALLAGRMVEALVLQWVDLIKTAQNARPQNRRQSYQGGHRSQFARSHDPAVCLRHLRAVTAWKPGFLQSLKRRLKQSPQQVEIPAGIAADLRKQV